MKWLICYLCLSFVPAYGFSQDPNFDNVITLYVEPGDSLWIGKLQGVLRAQTESFPVWIVSGQDTIKKIVPSKGGLTRFKVFASADSILVYGDIRVFKSISNRRKLKGLKAKSLTLKQIDATSNELSFLDVQQSPNLEALNVCGNNLTAIDVQMNSKIKKIQCSKNNLSVCGIDSLFLSLPDRGSVANGVLIVQKGNKTNPGVVGCRDTIATGKNWKVLNQESTSSKIDIQNTVYLCETPTQGLTATTLSSKVKLYPNPTRGCLFVSDAGDLECVEVVNLLGEIVLRKEVFMLAFFTMDLSSLLPGTYFVRMTTSSKGILVKKVVKF